MESKEFYCYNSNMASAYNIHLQETKDQTSKATDMSQIGELVRFHRKKSKLTQKQLADLSGVGKTVVYDIEKGKQSIQLKTLVQILKTLNRHRIFWIWSETLPKKYPTDKLSCT